MLDPSAYGDSFARDRLPPEELWPVLETAGLPELDYPKHLNAAVELLDRMVAGGFADSLCIRSPDGTATACSCAAPTIRCSRHAGSRH